MAKHITHIHKITTQNYYDTYLKTSNKEVFCKNCNKPVSFIDLTHGYRSYCNYTCLNNSKEVKQHKKETCIKKFGVENAFQSEEKKNKAKQTKLLKYGNENYNNKEKALETYHNKSKEEKDKQYQKMRQTNFKKYGVGCAFQASEVKEKIKETNLKRYGVTNTFQIPEISKKAKEKAHSSIVNKKRKQTNLNRYGFENPMQSPEIQNKIKQTNLKKYGVKNAAQSPLIIEKTKQTNLEKYGTTCALHSPSIKEKVYATNMKRYGVKNAIQNSEVYKRMKKHYKYDNLFFDSSWELAFYIYCNDAGINILREPLRLKYFDKNNIKRYYFPDFQLEDDRFEDNHVLIEIKGDHMLNDQMQLIDPKTKEIDYEKTQCMIDNRVYIMTFKDCEPFIKYCQEKFNDKKWYKQFIYHKDKGEQNEEIN